MMSNSQQSSALRPIVINGLFLLIGAFLGYLGTRANANAQIVAAQENAKAQVTAAAINVFGPISATQTAEAKITPLAPNTSTTAIDNLLLESIPQEVFSFQGTDEKMAGIANLRILYTLDHRPIYKLIYDLSTPTNQYGKAGLAFKFDGGIDVSKYKSLNFTIQFDTENQFIDLYLIDRATRRFKTITNQGQNLIDVGFSLSDFMDLDLHDLKEINFFVDTAQNTGDHTLFVSNIRFMK
jgi:hypothetical protein